MKSAKRTHPDFVEAHVRHMEKVSTHPIHDEWAALFSVAAAVGRRAWLDDVVYYHKCNMFVIFVGQPGSGKSAAISQGTTYLHAIPSIHVGADMITVPQLVAKMDSIQQLEPVIPLDTRDKSWVGTTERMRLRSQVMSNLSVVADELGTFLDMSQPMLFPTMIKLWDGNILHKETKTGSKEKLVNPWINFIGATTPAWISRSLTPKLLEDGWASRTIFVHFEDSECPKRQAHYRNVRELADFKQEIQVLTDDLRWIHRNMRGPMDFADGAIEFSTAFFDDVQAVARGEASSFRYSYLSRKFNNFIKCAMTYALGRGSFQVEVDDMRRAQTLLEATEPNMRRVFSTVAGSDAVKNAELLKRTFDQMANGADPPTLPKERLYRRLLQEGMSYPDFTHAMNTLTAAGELQTKGAHVTRLKTTH